jgi:hypothetical protein
VKPAFTFGRLEVDRFFPQVSRAQLANNRHGKRDRADLSRSGLLRSFRRSNLSVGASAIIADRSISSARIKFAASATAFAARSSGVPFFDRRGLREWTRRQASHGNLTTLLMAISPHRIVVAGDLVSAINDAGKHPGGYGTARLPVRVIIDVLQQLPQCKPNKLTQVRR